MRGLTTASCCAKPSDVPPACCSFMVNGGRLGFACKFSYPQSLLRGADEKVGASLPTSAAALTWFSPDGAGLCAAEHTLSCLRASQAVRAMLKGSDAAVLHALTALGIPTTLVRVWQEVGSVCLACWHPRDACTC